MRARIRTRDPYGLAIAFRHAPVGADSELEGHGGPTFRDTHKMSEGHGGGIRRKNAFGHFYAGPLQLIDAVSRCAGIRIADADDDAFDLGGDDHVAAWHAAPFVRTRLERYVDRAAFSFRPRSVKRNGLRMGATARCGPATANYLSRRHDDDRADGRIWPGEPQTASCETDRLRHMVLVARNHGKWAGLVFGFGGFIGNDIGVLAFGPGQFAEECLEILGFAKIPIHGGEAYIGHVVEPF